jgi:hypothetical protein
MVVIEAALLTVTTPSLCCLCKSRYIYYLNVFEGGVDPDIKLLWRTVLFCYFLVVVQATNLKM